MWLKISERLALSIDDSVTVVYLLNYKYSVSMTICICGLKLAKDWMRRDVYLCLPIAASNVVNHASFDLFCS